MNTTKANDKYIILRIIAFVLLFFVLLNALSIVFVPKYKNDSNGMVGYIVKSYKGESKNSIDVFMVGNSDAYRAFSPMYIWGESGITSCVSGKGKQDAKGAYKVLKDMYRYQTPEVVIVETDMFYDILPRIRNNSMPAFVNKLLDFKDFLKDGFKDFDDAATSGISYYFPILKYHGRWHEINCHDFKNPRASYSFDFKGFIPDFKTRAYTGGYSYMSTNYGKKDELKRSTLKYVDKIIKLCKENGSTVVFAEAPSAISWNTARHNAVKGLAEKYSVDFIDMNIEGTLEDFNWLTDTKDGGDHLNTGGAQKASRYICNYLNTNFNFESKKHNSDFDSWNQSYSKYTKELHKNEVNI